jgi:hypothetical protein
MWGQVRIFFLLFVLSAACDEACIRDCLADEDVDPSCFAQCTCSSPIRALPFGQSFKTESGAKYEIQALSYTEFDWMEKYYGCDITCATSCFAISKGQELVSCFGLCACLDLLRPKNDQAIIERTRSQALHTSGLLTSAACADQCTADCQEDSEDSFSKCFSACTRRVCLASQPLPSPSFPLYQTLYLISGLGAVGIYVYTQRLKRQSQAYKSL